MYKIKKFGWLYISNKEHRVVFPKEFDHVLSARRFKIFISEFNEEVWAWEIKLGCKTMWGTCKNEIEAIDNLEKELNYLISLLLTEVKEHE